jgi:hypothetical protein
VIRHIRVILIILAVLTLISIIASIVMIRAVTGDTLFFMDSTLGMICAASFRWVTLASACFIIAWIAIIANRRKLFGRKLKSLDREGALDFESSKTPEKPAGIEADSAKEPEPPKELEPPEKPAKPVPPEKPEKPEPPKEPANPALSEEPKPAAIEETRALENEPTVDPTRVGGEEESKAVPLIKLPDAEPEPAKPVPAKEPERPVPVKEPEKPVPARKPAKPADGKVPEKPASPKPPEAPATGAKAPALPLFCGNCGRQLTSAHKFCPKCGTPVAHK